jgi:acyl-CoA thioesterase-1
MPPARRWIPAGVVVIALLAGPGLLSQATKPNPAFAAVRDDASLPRVLLIGDSISIGYTLETRRLLAGKANLHRIPENGGPTIRGLEKLSGWLGDGNWDVIHFNWGLHDLKLMDGKHQVPIQDYEKNLRELVGRLRATGARLIWATTTPVPAGELSPPRRPGDVIAYNKVAGKIMDEGGIGVDDLYAFALPRLAEIQRPANVHFTEAGSAALAAEVAASILKALGR